MLNEERKNLTDEAYESIKNKICNFEIFPGQMISDFTLSKELKMSRTPIREALRRIESDGLITKGDKGQSYTVSEITKEDIIDLFDARSGIEVTSLNLFLRNGVDEEKLYSLKRINELMETENKNGRIRYQFNYDQMFHDNIVQLGNNARLVNFNNSLLLQLSRVRVLSYLERSYQDKAYREHNQLINFLLERKQAESINLLSEHIESTKSNYINLLENRVSGESFGVLSAVMRSEKI